MEVPDALDDFLSDDDVPDDVGVGAGMRLPGGVAWSPENNAFFKSATSAKSLALAYTHFNI